MKISKTIIAVLAILTAIVLVSCTGNTQSTQELEKTTTTESGKTQNIKKINLEELARHNTESDCWVVYKNNIYDITTLLPMHPDKGESIIPQCGTTNFELKFTDQHQDSKVSILESKAILIGELQN